MRKNFMKYLACALVAVMLLGTTAFAQVATTTTYNAGTDQLEVTATVSGAVKGEQVTYLVHSADTEDIADADIIYINQKPANDSGEASFSYKVAEAKLVTGNTPVSTSVIAGSSSGLPLADDEDNIDVVAATIVNATTIDDAALYTLDYKDWYGTENTATLEIIAEGSFKVNDNPYSGAITVEGGKTYTITQEEVVVKPSIVWIKTECSVDEADSADNYITVFATYSNCDDFAKCGVIFTDAEENDLDCVAIGDVGGQFAIKLRDNGSDLIASGLTMSATAYVVNNGDTLVDEADEIIVE